VVPTTSPPPPSITEPPTTEPPTTLPPTSEAPTTTRARPSTTRGSTSTVASTTTITLLPPPSIQPADPEQPPPGSTQSDEISPVFLWLSVIGFATGVALLGAQWFLTKPGRRGWTL
jgi:hypothetical protein